MKIIQRCTIFLLPVLLHATATMHCSWRAAYFDVLFVDNYGISWLDDAYTSRVAARSKVIIRIDSLLKTLRQEGKLEHFKRWTIIDSYTEKFDFAHVKARHGIQSDKESNQFLNLTDSIAVNEALKKLWNIEDVTISTSKPAGMWLFSLHLGLIKDALVARSRHPKYSSALRPDSALLWLNCGGDVEVTNDFRQHETDGYYHVYTGLYLTEKNVLEAQKLLLEKCNLKTTITSQYITSRIISRYASPTR